MNFDYFDVIGSEPKIDTEDEAIQLRNVADNIGSYLYSYTEDAQQQYGVDGNEHLGIIAQDLMRVPGLASAVTKDENGNYVVDAQKVALASLGLVAALSRYVLGENTNGKTSTELPSTVPVTEATSETGTEAGETSSGGDKFTTGTTGDDVTTMDTVEAVKNEPSDEQ